MSPQIGADFILPAFAVVVLGGLGSVTSAYVGGFLIGITGRAQGMRVPYHAGWVTMIFPQRIAYAWLMLGFLGLSMVVSLTLLRSRLGYYLQAVRDNEQAAAACGIGVLPTKLAGFAVTGIGGSLFMMYVRIVDPPTLLTRKRRRQVHAAVGDRRVAAPDRRPGEFAGADITGRPAHRGPGSGLALVPEGGRLFPFLTVAENLKLGGFAEAGKQERARRLEEAMDTFPILRERHDQLAGKLSGGERQMCAVARAMMSRPQLMMLDEPSVGLSPLMVERILLVVRSLVTSQGLTVLLVEQNIVEALDMADRAYVLSQGASVQDGTAAQIAADPQVQQTYMGL